MKIRKLWKIVSLVIAAGCLGGTNAEAQKRILPLGDSITSSFSPNYSYRFFLWHRLQNNRKKVDFVGSQWGVSGGAPARDDFDQNHEGHPGWTSADILANIDQIAAAADPDIVLLDIGGNDVELGVPMSTIAANLKEIIHRLRLQNSRVTILLAQPTPYQGPNSGRMSTLKGVIAKVAKSENWYKSRIIVVDLFSGFSVSRDTFDGTHPDESGDRKIATKYWWALQKVL